MLLSGIVINMLKYVVDHLHKTSSTATLVDFIPKSGAKDILTNPVTCRINSSFIILRLALYPIYYLLLRFGVRIIHRTFSEQLFKGTYI